MKVSANPLSELLLRPRAFFQGDDPARNYIYEAPLRAELYSYDQMAQRGKTVAASHKLLTGNAPNRLLTRLADNERILIEVRDLLAQAIETDRRITPAGEWLLDNFYVIDEHILLAKRHFPKGYSMGLPRLASGASEGLPRVYDIALEIISHSDGRLDLMTLRSFINSYQSLHKLTIGELWAVPIMLRLALIENLRRVSARIAMDKIDQNLAGHWAEQMMTTADEAPGELILLLADMARATPPLESPFVSELNRRLLGKGPALAMALTWMEQQLTARGTTSNELIHFENQKQAADQVSVSNSIGSLKFLGSTDWRDFVEELSSMEAILREDISGVYGRMDFATRDSYRHIVEAVAKHGDCSENEAARIAIGLAAGAAAGHGPEDRRAHVGYFLTDAGRAEFQRAAGMPVPLFQKLKQRSPGLPVRLYLGQLAILTLLLAGGLSLAAYQCGLRGYLLALVMALSLIVVTQLASMLVNWVSTLIVRPKPLPRMDYSKGIPSTARSLVVVPTMLTSQAGLESLIEGLEVRFLANSDAHLHYALLTDFPDAPMAELPQDAGLIEAAEKCIHELNRKYSRSGNRIFFFFHRPRTWNQRDKVWMGYERKRGKLAQLNQLLRGESKDAFSSVIADESIFPSIRYIITLDTDTQLPRDAARKLVATMAHPLNVAVYSETKRRVVEGYGILQPRVAVSMTPADGSRYLRMHANDTGLDPYTRVVSDVYQDLFGEGSFIGKGIYDIDIFEKSLHERFPENRILSHDLLEGNYARSGLLSDVQVYEENPSRYSSDVKRRHRWLRGDWQVGGWMLPWVPKASGKGLKRNRLSTLARWKIFDNIRRSLVSPAVLLFLLLAWTALPMPGFWTFAILLIYLIPPFITSVWQALHKSQNLGYGSHLKDVAVAMGEKLFGLLFTLACLPYEVFYSIDAIIRTNWRMIVSKRGLLEWTPSAAVGNGKKSTLGSEFIRMWIGPALALAVGIYLAATGESALLWALPLLLLWVFSPAIVWWISEPLQTKTAEISEDQRRFLLKISRKTWGFFERFVGPEDNWLPPDNFQEHPAEKLAHRTSPTNMGLALLANLSAYDFGYISAETTVARCAETLKTMDRLERHRGHFLNWYDTETCNPLLPRYISAVDSGNLAGHLLTLRQGLLELIRQPVINPALFAGIRDLVMVLVDASEAAAAADLKPLLALTERYARDVPATVPQTVAALDEIADAIVNKGAGTSPEAAEWEQHLRDQIRHARAEIQEWFSTSDAGERQGSGSVPSLYDISRMRNPVGDPGNADSDRNNPAPGPHDDPYDTDFLSRKAAARIRRIEELAAMAAGMAEMEYEFLYDKPRQLLRIGYNVDEGRDDASYYDLLASEARLGHFVAIAQGRLPQDSWFALGRLLTNTGGDPVLLSWSGSMFEYLMPMLVMPSYENTLLDHTHKATVKRQIAYGKQRGVPWGVSEAGFNAVDAALNYQYRAFGVPGLGLKRGLGDDLVIAPYASMMALMVDPAAAVQNLQTMSAAGFEGRYGFYEAIDYTPARMLRGEEHAVVRSFMVHHQGMGLLGLAYLLLDKPMQRRFEAEPQLQATLLLLQERVPKGNLFYTHNRNVTETNTETGIPEIRVIDTPHTPAPEVQLLTNSKYQVVITNSGGGYSRWKDVAVTRWREDSTRDNWGVFCYIKEPGSGEFWSNTFQPTLKKADHYEAVFSQGHAEFRRQDNGFETYTEVVVSPEDDIEIRRVRITNRTLVVKTIEVTSYAEVVLAAQASDTSHPAFSNLFVQTEIHPVHNAIICSRRPRSSDEVPPWMFHQMTVQGSVDGAVSFETDRMKFIGRGNTPAWPAAIQSDKPLSGSEGSVLDPIVSVRYRIVLKPGQTATVDLVIGMGERRDTCLRLLEKYHDRHLKNRAFGLSWTHSQVLLRQINATEADAQLYGRLAGHIVYSNPELRADRFIIKSNQKGQSGLWSYAISGDLPILLLRVHDSGNVAIVQQLIQAHAYWRLKGLAVDLVIWNEDHGSYRQVLQDQIMGMVNAVSGYTTGKPGSVFVRSADQISNEDRILFQTVARAIIYDNRGTLAEQIGTRDTVRVLPPALKPTAPYHRHVPRKIAAPAGLLFGNGHGGFSEDGREYIIVSTETNKTPVPWVNVIANKDFGTVVSESGSAYTWAENAHEFRLSPWHNDPVSDQSGEAFYIRDEETGYFWSPTQLPARGQGSYTTRHGFGYSIFEHDENGIETTMTTFVDTESSVKFITIKVRNNSGRQRSLSATGYVEWVLGDERQKTQMHVVTELDLASGAIFSRNRYNTTFASRLAFFDTDDTTRSYTGDRVEFIGRNGSLQRPAAMFRTRLSGNTGSGLDPCSAMQVYLDLGDGEEREIIFRLGTARRTSGVRELAQRMKGSAVAAKSLQTVQEYWRGTLGAVQVQTPDKALNVLANGWLPYQTLACRIWARSGYYQSGGAFGFRDQLQDVLALIHTKPDLARAQILLCASRQFKEGDVQHWWHPPLGRGVRTRCSDDYLWLPFATSRYVLGTNDLAVLDQPVTYLDGRQLNDGEESYYDLPNQLETPESLYQHCVAAIRHGFRRGVHGLPLIGTGDWNDGMDRVGLHDKGESIWLGFFSYDVLRRFRKVALQYGDEAFAEECEREANTLRTNLDENGWDGEWYRRAYFDDGTPLGTADSDECRIDSISQSWAVLSGAGRPKRSRQGMAAVDKYLVRRDLGLIQLLDPPFDKSALNPGYIKGYVPGVRENGGQYTHAAIWTIMAFAALGENEKAWELFSMINPVNHGNTPEGIAIYKAEPYVAAADIYAADPHEGRGGWTWYTGSAGWMNYLILDSILGLKIEADILRIVPCIPQAWDGYKVEYRYRSAVYHIEIIQSKSRDGHARLTLDGVVVDDGIVHLADDGKEHRVELIVRPGGEHDRPGFTAQQ